METVAKQEAAERVMARGSALDPLFSVALEFTFAGPGPCAPLGPGEESRDTYSMSALYVAGVGSQGVLPILRLLHSHWSAEGWTSTVEYFASGGVVTAHDPFDGFTYTVEDRESGDSVVVRVSSPCYRNPQPRAVFTGIYPD